MRRVLVAALVLRGALASQSCAGWEYTAKFTRPTTCVPCCGSKCTSSDGKGGSDCWADGSSDPFSCADEYVPKKSGRETTFLGRTYTEFSCCQPGAPAAVNSSNCRQVECMIHGGLERCWEIFRPPSKLSSPVRVVIDLHGYSGNIVSYPLYSGWGRIAERDGFIVVWPQGSTELEGHSDKQPSWNAGMCCGSSDDKHAKIDDVGFLRKLATR